MSGREAVGEVGTASVLELGGVTEYPVDSVYPLDEGPEGLDGVAE